METVVEASRKEGWAAECRAARDWLSGLCCGGPQPAQQTCLYPVCSIRILKEAAPEPWVSREDSVPSTPRCPPEHLLLRSRWLGLNQFVVFPVWATLSSAYCHSTKTVSSLGVPSACPVLSSLVGLPGSS